MGNMKYPIGIQSFEKIITEGYLYIDKPVGGIKKPPEN